MSGRRERARARARRRRRRLMVAHAVSVAVHLLPLVALVGFEWPDLDAEPEPPMRRVVEVRLEQRRPPRDVMFQAAHDADVEKATTAVASGAARRTRGGAVAKAAAARRPVAGAAAVPSRTRPAVAATHAAPRLPPHPPRRTPSRGAGHPARVVAARAASRPTPPPRPAEAVLASAHLAPHGRVLALARAPVSLPPASVSPEPAEAVAVPAPAHAPATPSAQPAEAAGGADDVALADDRIPAPPSPVAPPAPATGAPTPQPEASPPERQLQAAEAAPAAHIPDLEPALRTQVPARAMLLAAYLRRVRDRIRREWHPKLVLGGGHPVWRPVEVQVYMAVAADGTLETVRVARSCGDARIDDQALAAVRRAQPFLPPPAALLHGGMVGFTFGATALGPATGVP